MTDTKLLKLPIGIQTFEDIRRDGYIYVDKTKYLIDLIDGGKVYFLSRPRRFGKSLTVSTFDALFSGKRELFKGLYAEEFFERPEYKTYPVVRFDMSKVTTGRGVDELEMSMLIQVLNNARRHGVEIPEPIFSVGRDLMPFAPLIPVVEQKHAAAQLPRRQAIDECFCPCQEHLEIGRRYLPDATLISPAAPCLAPGYRRRRSRKRRPGRRTRPSGRSPSSCSDMITAMRLRLASERRMPSSSTW